MKKLMIILAAAIALAGCHTLSVENRGEEVVRDAQGNPILLQDGTAQLRSRGWKATKMDHWTDEAVEDFSANVERGKFGVSLGSYSNTVSQELAHFMDVTLTRAAQLAAKVGAAIATAGGSAGAEGIAALVKKFVKAGGDASKTTVKCEGGNCSISDGSITCTDAGCVIGDAAEACADGACEIVGAAVECDGCSISQ